MWLLWSIGANPHGISLLTDPGVSEPVLPGQGRNTVATFGPKLMESCHRLPHRQDLAWLHWHWISCVCVRESKREQGYKAKPRAINHSSCAGAHGTKYSSLLRLCFCTFVCTLEYKWVKSRGVCVWGGVMSKSLPQLLEIQ